MDYFFDKGMSKIDKAPGGSYCFYVCTDISFSFLLLSSFQFCEYSPDIIEIAIFT